MAPILPLPALHTFIKRGDSVGIELDLPPFVVILLCLVGALFGLLVAYGIARFFFDVTQPSLEPSASQHDYMRDVRARNLNSLMAEGHAARYASTRYDDQRHVSMS
ncbi:hypothetical protein DM02DRAFT_106657 [Periconia macrospinosa]|uniref:Uncharacterized protein n=1 Tax=Periconia macrospinosa TaxID=97972 RepID=A0A2V1DGI2_9PLEO|nr:hypothetical protein DM02DRAFT_106657 [Periconia macrospinosa]